MNKDDSVIRTIVTGFAFVFGVFLLALCFNVLLEPNDLVVGGMSGLGIVLEEVFGWNATVFIYISTFSLLLVSYIFLGKEKTSYTIVGSILYPLMLSITQPIATFILNLSDLHEQIVIVCLAGFFYGVANGIIYKMGFTTGGGDVVMQIVSKYFKISTAAANFIYSFIIISLSGLVFGLESLVYAVIVLLISNFIINYIIEGISNSKVFFICTKKGIEIKKMINDEYQIGYTLIPTKSTLLHKRGEIIMVVLPTREYHNFKNKVLDIDDDAFFIINDCYEVGGGSRIENIPFISN